MIVVYTCITNNVDDITALSNRRFNDLDANYHIFSDKEVIIPGWTVNRCDSKYGPLKTPRWYKTNGHLCFPFADAYIWIDGNQIPNGNATFLLEKGPLATFKHPKRDCVYDEMMACDRIGKDHLKNMAPQIEKYHKFGYPKNNGLAETSCIYRDNTPEINAFNTIWWKEIKEHSHRDQLSFDYAAYISGIRYNIIQGSRIKSEFLEFTGDH